MKKTKTCLCILLCVLLMMCCACEQQVGSSQPSDPRIPSNIGENGMNETQGLKYTVHRVWTSKELQDGVANAAYVNPRNGEEMAEDGTFTSAHSYFFVNLTIENISFPRDQLYLNMLQIYPYNGAQMLEHGDGYPRTMNYNLEMAGDPCFFIIDTYEGQSVQYTLAFVLSDEVLKQATDYYLLLNPNGGTMEKFEDGVHVGWAGGIQFIKLDDFMEE